MLYTWLSESDEEGAMAPSQEQIETAFSPIFSSLRSELGTDQERKSAWFWMQQNRE